MAKLVEGPAPLPGIRRARKTRGRGDRELSRAAPANRRGAVAHGNMLWARPSATSLPARRPEWLADHRPS
eukprot:15450795-Alexandrium_andersonii.AAC.1